MTDLNSSCDVKETANNAKYRTLQDEIRYKCRQAKEEWFNKTCAEIERNV